MSLTVEQVAAYLPHRVKVMYLYKYDKELIDYLDIVATDSLVSIEGDEHLYDISEIKLVLRPMSDYKVITHIPILMCNYEHVVLLLSQKFDVFGLIDKGLAVSCHDVGVEYIPRPVLVSGWDWEITRLDDRSWHCANGYTINEKDNGLICVVFDDPDAAIYPKTLEKAKEWCVADRDQRLIELGVIV